MRNSFTSTRNTPHIIESSPGVDFNPLQAIYCLLPDRKDTSSQHIGSEALFSWSLGDEYMGSTSPYDDDGS